MRNRGFTLTEALVATVLAGIMMTMLLQVLGNSAGLSHRAGIRHDAIALAQMVLATQRPSGANDTFQWTFVTEPSPFDPSRTSADGYRLERQTVTVKGNSLSRPVTLVTESLVKR